MKLTEEKKLVVTPEDRDCCLGKSDLKTCPFCGRKPISAGKLNEETGIHVHQVICIGTDCMASIHFGDRDPEKARQGAVLRWNRRGDWWKA
jgi:hypothetical protein